MFLKENCSGLRRFNIVCVVLNKAFELTVYQLLFLVQKELAVLNKAWYYPNRSSNTKPQAHRAEFPPAAQGTGRPHGVAEREPRTVKTEISSYKSSKRPSRGSCHKDAGTNKAERACKAGYPAKTRRPETAAQQQRHGLTGLAGSPALSL